MPTPTPTSAPFEIMVEAGDGGYDDDDGGYDDDDDGYDDDGGGYDDDDSYHDDDGRCSSQSSVRSNTQAWGTTLTVFGGISLEDCCTKCAQDVQCTTYSFKKLTGQCILLSSVQTTYESLGYQTGQRVVLVEEASPFPSPVANPTTLPPTVSPPTYLPQNLPTSSPGDLPQFRTCFLFLLTQPFPCFRCQSDAYKSGKPHLRF
jgi:hypothetical protein